MSLSDGEQERERARFFKFSKSKVGVDDDGIYLTMGNLSNYIENHTYAWRSFLMGALLEDESNQFPDIPESRCDAQTGLVLRNWEKFPLMAVRYSCWLGDDGLSATVEITSGRMIFKVDGKPPTGRDAIGIDGVIRLKE